MIEDDKTIVLGLKEMNHNFKTICFNTKTTDDHEFK